MLNILLQFIFEDDYIYNKFDISMLAIIFVMSIVVVIIIVKIVIVNKYYKVYREVVPKLRP